MSTSSAKRRFIAKQRDKTWWVYDTALGAWPRARPGVGKVKTDFRTEEECLKEAERLEQFHRKDA